MALTKKEEYYLNELRSKELCRETIELDNDIKTVLLEKAKEKGISLSEYINLVLTRTIIDIEKAKYIDKYEDIIDIYDMYDIETLMDTGKEYLVINPNGKHLMLLPYKIYEELMENIKELKNEI